MKMGKRGGCCLTMCVLLFLTACGKDSTPYESNNTHAFQKQKWVYVPEVITVGDEYTDYGQMQLVEDTFCYMSQGGDVENGEKSICWYSLNDCELTSVPINWPEGGVNWDVGVWSFNRDHSVYLTANVYSSDYSLMKRFLCKFDSEGNCLFSQDITERLGRGHSIDRLTMDGQGRLYLFADNEILLYTGDGVLHGSVGYSSLDSTVVVHIRGAGIGSDGRYYVCIGRDSIDNAEENADGVDSSCTLMEINFDSVRLKEVARELPNINGLCVGIWQSGEDSSDQAYYLLLYDNRAVYGYNFVTQKNSGSAGEELFVWTDSDINGYCVTNLFLLDDGRLCVTVEDWDNGQQTVVMLKRTKADT